MKSTLKFHVLLVAAVSVLPFSVEIATRPTRPTCPTFVLTECRAATSKNVILMVGDGMGLSMRTLLHYYLGHTPAMNDMPVVGLMTTEPAPSKPGIVDVTDSAAAATAMACGIKSYNEAISVDLDRKPIPTVLEAAKDAGKATGLVVTCQINHATPACFAAHDPKRDNYDAIALDYLATQPDVMLGAGTEYFLPAPDRGGRKDGRDLVAEFRAIGYQTLLPGDDLASVHEGRLLGLFGKRSLSPAIDAEGKGEPSLREMTAKALELLAQDPEGFFLLVEGSQIDWAGHANDPAWLIGDMVAFDEAVAEACAFAARTPGTLVVVLADHETGGLAIGRDYELNVPLLRRLDRSVKELAAAIEAAPTDAEKILFTHTGIDSLGDEGKKLLLDFDKINPGVQKLINRRLGLSWAHHDHTGTLIPVTAVGAGAELFAGSYDNTDIARKIATALGVSLENTRPREHTEDKH